MVGSNWKKNLSDRWLCLCVVHTLCTPTLHVEYPFMLNVQWTDTPRGLDCTSPQTRLSRKTIGYVTYTHDIHKLESKSTVRRNGSLLAIQRIRVIFFSRLWSCSTISPVHRMSSSIALELWVSTPFVHPFNVPASPLATLSMQRLEKTYKS